MKFSKKQTVGENLLYVMVWTAIILVPVLNSQMMSETHLSFENALVAWRKIAPYFLIFIVHNNIIAPLFMLRHKYWRYIISNLILVVGIFGMVDYYEENIAQNPIVTAYAQAGPTGKASFTDLAMYWNVVLAFFMVGANTGIKLMYRSIKDEQEMEQLKRQNLQAEMDYLKYQINPHFFMNTLNNIHALIDIDSECAKQTVIELSKMMRYVLYDSGHEKISLHNDIQFLKNYIELMKIRYTDAIDIKVEEPENLSKKVTIPPLLLIVFVENAFKHGISYNRSSFIHIKIQIENEIVKAYFSNSRHMPTKKAGSGIGLDNVRKRLELIYGSKNYTLDIQETEDTYNVQLLIPTLHA